MKPGVFVVVTATSFCAGWRAAPLPGTYNQNFGMETFLVKSIQVQMLSIPTCADLRSAGMEWLPCHGKSNPRHYSKKARAKWNVGQATKFISSLTHPHTRK